MRHTERNGAFRATSPQRQHRSINAWREQCGLRRAYRIHAGPLLSTRGNRLKQIFTQQDRRRGVNQRLCQEQLDRNHASQQDAGRNAQDPRNEEMMQPDRDPTETPDSFTQEEIDAIREKLKTWTANPEMQIQHFIQAKDGGADCFSRATEYIPKYWNVVKVGPVQALQGDLFTTAQKEFEKQPAYGNKLRVVVIRVSEPGFAGSSGSRFGTFHFLLVIAALHGYCVLYDPDVTATEWSRDAWAQFSGGIKLNEPASKGLIDTMVLGNGRRLGALVRYYCKTRT
jgi:hypothetical protein